MIKIVDITDGREIPMSLKRFVVSDAPVRTKEDAMIWGNQHGVLTVYWHEALASCFGYVGQ